ncbi:MAG: cytochrome c biogenesis protein ResB [Candidatus Desantisbacteria bacterium]
MKSFLGSKRLAIVLLIILSLACIIGSIKDSEAYYHSFWFVGILVLLCLNILVCFLSRHRRMGSYLFHLGILVILSGGMMGSLMGFEEDVKIREGKIASLLHSDLKIKLHNFTIEYYPDSLMPKDYKSKLTIIESGREVKTMAIEVNHPLIYKGVWFYQSSYGQDGVRSVNLNVNGVDWTGRLGENFRIPKTSLVVKPVQFLFDFSLYGDKAYSKTEEANNPAVKLEVYDGERLKFSQWVFSKFPDYHQKEKGIKFRLTGFTAIPYSGIHVVKDPGLVVFWIGCCLFLVGIVISFFGNNSPQRRKDAERTT